MSEYIEIESEFGDELDTAVFHTNLTLTEGEAEVYDSVEAMEEGSPVAQALAVVAGIERARLAGGELTVQRDPAVDWYAIVADVSAVLKEFFL